MKDTATIRLGKSKAQKKFTSIGRQKGWTMWSLMFVGGVIVFFVYIGFQLVPVYSGNANVKNAMQAAIERVSPSSVSRNEVIKIMRAQLNLDGAKKSLNYKKDITVKRTKRQLIIATNYERRVELFYNLSLVATFNNEVTRDL